MTQEELEKKAKEYSSKYASQYYHNDKSGFTTSEEEVYKAYVAGAKEMQRENEQLKQQNAKLRCCVNCKHFKAYNEYTDNVYYACELEKCDDLDNWEFEG